MLKNLPSNPAALVAWTWPEIEPYYQELGARALTAANVDAWLEDWSGVGERVEEMYARLSVATSVNTADNEADQRMNQFLDRIYPNVTAAEQKLKEKLLASQLEPHGWFANYFCERRNHPPAPVRQRAGIPLLRRSRHRRARPRNHRAGAGESARLIFSAPPARAWPAQSRA